MSVNVSYKDTLHSYVVSQAMLVQNLKEEISEKQNLYQFKLMLGQAKLIEQCPVVKYLFTNFALCYDDKEAAVEINDFTLGVAVIKPEDQKVFTEKATLEMTVGQLKERISRKLISTQGKWTLKKDGRDVPDEDLLQTHLVVKTFTVNMQDMHVIIRTDAKSDSITTRSDMTILEFKRLIYNKTGLPVEQIGLTFGGEYLDQYEVVDSQTEKSEMKRVYESRTLGSYRIVDSSVLLVVSKVPGGFRR